ncbi:MAG: heme biosynthesis HemY N-terminal domain-containing protein, partial [Planctomycetota bacterium]
MIRLIFFFLVVGLIAYGFAWLADQPGNLIVNWQERRIEMPIFWAFVGLGLLVAAMVFLWSALTGLIRSPAMITDAFKRRTQRRGLEALST